MRGAETDGGHFAKDGASGAPELRSLVSDVRAHDGGGGGEERDSCLFPTTVKP